MVKEHSGDLHDATEKLGRFLGQVVESHPDMAGKVFYEADEESQVVKEYDRIHENLECSCWCDQCIAELQANASDATGDADEPADRADV